MIWIIRVVTFCFVFNTGFVVTGQKWKEIVSNRQNSLADWEVAAARRYAALKNATSDDQIRWPRFSRVRPQILTCYYTYDPPNGPKPSEIDAHMCTHILLFGGGLDHNLNFTYPAMTVLKDVYAIKERNPQLKLLLTFGPLSNANMSVVVAHEALINRFASQVVEFLELSKFDGLDIDWEFPVWSGAPTDKQGFVNLLKELRRHFNATETESRFAEKYLLSAAVPAPWNIVDVCCDVPEINKHVDFVNLMAYDFHKFSWYTPFTGHNAPLFKKPLELWLLGRINTEYAAFYWYKQGMDHWKILVGIPTYARGFTLLTKYLHFDYAPAVGVSALGDSSTYYEVMSLIGSGCERVWDDHAMVPYCHKESDWWSYEDVDSARIKATWIRQQNFGGAMLFILNSDDWAGVYSKNGSKYPITTVVHDTLYQHHSLYRKTFKIKKTV